jgi:hypothetical protein
VPMPPPTCRSRQAEEARQRAEEAQAEEVRRAAEARAAEARRAEQAHPDAETGPALVLPHKPSVAVLPFTNMSG